MSVKHLNCCREVKRQFGEQISKSGRISKTIPPEVAVYRDLLIEISDKIDKSVKFILPLHGITVNDPELKALYDIDLELPFPCIALEFDVTTEEDNNHLMQYEKSLVLAEDIGDQIEIQMAIKRVEVPKSNDSWVAYPPIRIPKKDFIGERIDGKVELRKILKRDSIIPIEDYQAEIAALLDFLNALSCRNVHIEKSKAITPSVRSKSGKKKKIKTTIPYDDYHYLTVDVPSKRYSNDNSDGIGDRRTPREHLRRGHIRRYSWGKIWINATVVNPGIGNKVDKIYKLRNREGGININTR